MVISLLSKFTWQRNPEYLYSWAPCQSLGSSSQRTVVFKLLLVTIMIGEAEVIRMCLPGARVTFLQGSSAKLKRSEKEEEEETGGETFVVWGYRRQKLGHKDAAWGRAHCCYCPRAHCHFAFYVKESISATRLVRPRERLLRKFAKKKTKITTNKPSSF